MTASTPLLHSTGPAWAKSREREAGEKAEALIDQMIKLHENGHKDVRYEATSISTFLSKRFA